MDISVVPNKRKHAPDRIPSPPSKRHRQPSPKSSRFEEEEDQDDAEFLNTPGAKKELVDELRSLAIPTVFESAAEHAEEYLPVCPAHEHVQHILDTYEGDDSDDDVSHQHHAHNLNHSSVLPLDHASQTKENQHQQEQNALPARQKASQAPVQPTGSIADHRIPGQPGAPPWKKYVNYKPLFWPVADLDKKVAVKNSSASETQPHQGDEELNTLDLSEDLKLGSLWTHLRENAMADLLIDPSFVPRSHQVERDDFLKACSRLRHMIHPNHLSTLLGASSRPPQYCEFLLNAMLGFYNVPDIRRRIDSRNRGFKAHVNIDVYHDAMYPDDDPIIKRLDRLQKRDEFLTESDREKRAFSRSRGDSYREELILLSDDPMYRESDQDEKETPHFESQQLRYEDTVVEEIAEYASYFLRSYMHSISGETFYNVNDFAMHCQQLGVSFLDAQRPSVNHCDGDLKWIKEPILAATIGKRSTVKEPLQVWQYAMDNFSVQNLARCALIRADSLMDWLEYVLILKNPRRKIEDHFMYERPIVCLEPVALLHLSDIAANFALDVLQRAVQIAESEQISQAAEQDVELAEEASDTQIQDSEDRNDDIQADNVDNGDEDITIDIDDIRKAARSKLRNSASEGAVLVHNLFDDVKCGNDKFIDFLRTESQWPRRRIRPYTSAETFRLCSRFPMATVSIPYSAIREKRAIVMGMTYLRHNDVYTAGTGAGAFWPRRKLPVSRERLELSKGPYAESPGSAVEGAVTSENHERRKFDPSKTPAGSCVSKGSEDPYKAAQAKSIAKSEKVVALKQTLDVEKTNDNQIEPQGTTPVMIKKNQTRSADEKNKNQLSTTDFVVYEKGDAVNAGPYSRHAIQASPEAHHPDLTTQRWNVMKKKYAEFFTDVNEAKKLQAQHHDRSARPKALHAELLRSKICANGTGNDEELYEGIADDDYLRHTSSSLCYNRLYWIVLHALGINIGQRISVHNPLTYASAANYTNFRHLTAVKPLSIDREALYELASLTELIVRDEAEILMECAIQDDGRPWIDRADVALVHAVRKKEFPYNRV